MFSSPSAKLQPVFSGNIFVLFKMYLRGRQTLVDIFEKLRLVKLSWTECFGKKPSPNLPLNARWI